jgi:hypothetical protein
VSFFVRFCLLPSLALAVIMVLHLVIALVLRGSPADRKKWNLWDILIYLGTLGCVAVLAVTSFVEVLRHGELGGWPLFFHMFGAGAFTAILPLLALSWAHLNQFRRWPEHRRNSAAQVQLASQADVLGDPGERTVVTMTMLLSMLPVFGSDGLRTSCWIFTATAA